MKLNLIASIAFASTFAFGVSVANATETPNSTPSVAWDYGCGAVCNAYSPANTLVATDGNVELDLRAHVRGDFAPASTVIGGVNTYSFALGQDLGIDFGITNLTGNTLLGFTPSVTVFDVANNNTQSFNFASFSDNPNNGLANAENSEALHFGFVDSAYNANNNDTFIVTLSEGGLSPRPFSVTMNVIQGAGAPGGVPEPATWALMILGFGSAGAMLRRRKLATA